MRVDDGAGRPSHLRRRAARRALHRRRRPRQREHRPDRRPPRLPLRAQPPRRAHQGDVAARSTAIRRFLNQWLLSGRGTSHDATQSIAWTGTASACSRRRSSAPRCSISTWCSRSSRARSSRRSTCSSRRPRCTTPTINPAIVAEFAHTVYRFGHSMLTETVDRFDPNFNVSAIHRRSAVGLIAAFLNPLAFAASGR